MNLPATRSQAIAVGASGFLLFAAALFRASYAEISLNSLLLSAALLTWDLGVTGLVHFSGVRLEASRVRHRQYEEGLEQCRVAREQVQSLETQEREVEAELGELARVERKALALDFDLNEVRAWASDVCRATYVMQVHKNRGKRYPKAEGAVSI